MAVDSGVDNFGLLIDPGPNHDRTIGYGIGSSIFNKALGKLRWWNCLDPSPGSAKWVFLGADYANGGTNPSSDATQGGSSAAIMSAEGCINRQVPGVAGAVSPGATAADNVVAVYSLPANFFDGLAGTNRGITVSASGVFAGNANTKQIKIFFNPATAVVGSTIGASGTLVADTGAVVTNGGGWLLSGSVYKTGASGSDTQTVISKGAVAAAAYAGVSVPVDATADEDAVIFIAVTINNTTTATDASLAFFEVTATN